MASDIAQADTFDKALRLVKDMRADLVLSEQEVKELTFSRDAAAKRVAEVEAMLVKAKATLENEEMTLSMVTDSMIGDAEDLDSALVNLSEQIDKLRITILPNNAG